MKTNITSDITSDLLRVRKNSFNLEYIKNQTERICFEAVKRHSRVLKYVKNQTLELCLVAVKKAAGPFDLLKTKQINFVLRQ